MLGTQFSTLDIFFQSANEYVSHYSVVALERRNHFDSKFNLSLCSDNVPVREGDLEYNTHVVDISHK